MWGYFNSELKDWNIKCKIHSFCLHVNIDGTQEQRFATTKNSCCFYPGLEQLRLKIKSWEIDIQSCRLQNTVWRGQSVTAVKGRKPLCSLTQHLHVYTLSHLVVTGLWRVFAYLTFFPQISVIARERQFLFNKSENFTEGVKRIMEFEHVFKIQLKKSLIWARNFEIIKYLHRRIRDKWEDVPQAAGARASERRYRNGYKRKNSIFGVFLHDATQPWEQSSWARFRVRIWFSQHHPFGVHILLSRWNLLTEMGISRIQINSMT